MWGPPEGPPHDSQYEYDAWAPRHHHGRRHFRCFATKIIEFLRSAGEMIYRELHVQDFIDYAEAEALEFKDFILDRWGSILVDGLNDKTNAVFVFAQKMDDRINDNIAEICANGQPANFWVDPVHYMICSYTVEYWLRSLELRVMKPLLKTLGHTTRRIDYLLLGQPEDFSTLAQALY